MRDEYSIISKLTYDAKPLGARGHAPVMDTTIRIWENSHQCLHLLGGNWIELPIGRVALITAPKFVYMRNTSACVQGIPAIALSLDNHKAQSVGDYTLSAQITVSLAKVRHGRQRGAVP